MEEDSTIGAEHDNIGGNVVDRGTSAESSIIYSDFAKWISSFEAEIDNYAQMGKSIQKAFLEKMAALAADIRAEMKFWIAARFKTADSSPMAAPTQQRIDELSAMGDLLAEMMGDAGSYFDEYNAASAEHWKKVAAERQKEIDEANRQEKASLAEQAKGFGVWIGEKLLDGLNPIKRIEKFASCLTSGITHVVDRIGGLCEGDWHRAVLGTEGAKYVKERGEAWGGDVDAYAKAYYSEIMNRWTGVRDIGDGIENGDLDQLLRGLETYGNAAATVGAFASWRMARNCFVAGTEVVVLAEGLDPDQANFLLAHGQLPEQLCTTRNIEEVKAGDWVLSRRWENGNAPLCFSKVEQTFVNTVDVIVELGIGTDESTAGTIRTTMGHPFWVTQTAGGPAPLADPASPHVNERLTYQLRRDGSTKSRDAGWVFATDLAVGDELSAATRGCNDQNPQVWSIEHLPQPGPRVYNFCVGGSHSYFVSATGADAKSSSWVWVHNTNGAGRAGKQARLRELGQDPNVAKRDRGWIKQEINQIKRGKRKSIRVPPGKNLAHRKGQRAVDGHGYEASDLQDIDLHKLEHKHEGY